LIRWKKTGKFGILKENFPNPEVADPIQPESKNFDPDPLLNYIF